MDVTGLSEEQIRDKVYALYKVFKMIEEEYEQKQKQNDIEKKK